MRTHGCAHIPAPMCMRKRGAREGIKFQLWDDDSNETGNIANRSFLGKVKIEPEVPRCSEYAESNPEGARRSLRRSARQPVQSATMRRTGPAPAEAHSAQQSVSGPAQDTPARAPPHGSALRGAVPSGGRPPASPHARGAHAPANVGLLPASPGFSRAVFSCAKNRPASHRIASHAATRRPASFWHSARFRSQELAKLWKQSASGTKVRVRAPLGRCTSSWPRHGGPPGAVPHG